ncbi:MAG: hypothetical protein GY774_34995 [Planctomycetes bacterium]|nr:hypothetical protein [Planctomycetota bacterium]|tara:strand:+ start:751 stop:1314 length:564 start_codon:yes stop_codon:yes gene_type:complete
MNIHPRTQLSLAMAAGLYLTAMQFVTELSFSAVGGVALVTIAPLLARACRLNTDRTTKNLRFNLQFVMIALMLLITGAMITVSLTITALLLSACAIWLYRLRTMPLTRPSLNNDYRTDRHHYYVRARYTAITTLFLGTVTACSLGLLALQGNGMEKGTCIGLTLLSAVIFSYLFDSKLAGNGNAATA